MDIDQVVGALVYLEKKFGSSPSIQDMAEYLGCSTATVQKWLKRAVKAGSAVKGKKNKYMSLKAARAFGAQE